MTEQDVLALNDPHKSYLYCRENKDANVKLHEDVIINSNNPCYAYLFAIDVDVADIERLQEVVINSNYPYYIYHFAFIENSNKEELFKALLKAGDEIYINLFIKNIELPEKLKELIIFI